jgi:hypothetical protein
MVFELIMTCILPRMSRVISVNNIIIIVVTDWLVDFQKFLYPPHIRILTTPDMNLMQDNYIISLVNDQIRNVRGMFHTY